MSVYLQSVINQGQDVLDCLLLGDVGHQVQKSLRTLSKKQNKYNLRDTGQRHTIHVPIDKLNKLPWLLFCLVPLKTVHKLPHVSKMQDSVCEVSLQEFHSTGCS